MESRRPERRGTGPGATALLLAGLLALACSPPGSGEGGPGDAPRSADAPGGSASDGAREGAAVADGRAPAYGIRVATDRAVYAPGDTIHMRLEVFRRGGDPVTLRFATAQRYDFRLRGPESAGPGREIWRWSEGRFFAQATSIVTLDGDRPTLTATASHPAPRDPGLYRVRGELASAEWPIYAVVPITVAP